MLATEASASNSVGSYGFWLIRQALDHAGHTVHTTPSGQYDIELVSVHHCLDYQLLSGLPRRAPVRLVGGHPVWASPRSVLPHADLVFVGEAERWIVEALQVFDTGGLDALASMPGVMRQGDDRPPDPYYERQLGMAKPYLNVAAEGHDRTWYIEIARGCPYSCAYCQIGCTRPYRVKHKRDVLAELDMCERSMSRKVTLMAPDEASHPAYQELIDEVLARGYQTMFGSMRMDQVARRGLRLPSTMHIRIGIDGLSERLRFAVGKEIANAQIVDYFRVMADSHSAFKIFQIVGYPEETDDDWREWETTMREALMIPRRTGGHLRVKWTPLIPQPGTPLADADVSYPRRIIARIMQWHEHVWQPLRNPGIYVHREGPMGRRSWQKQVDLTRAS